MSSRKSDTGNTLTQEFKTHNFKTLTEEIKTDSGLKRDLRGALFLSLEITGSET